MCVRFWLHTSFLTKQTAGVSSLLYGFPTCMHHFHAFISVTDLDHRLIKVRCDDIDIHNTCAMACTC